MADRERNGRDGKEISLSSKPIGVGVGSQPHASQRKKKKMAKQSRRSVSAKKMKMGSGRVDPNPCGLGSDRP
ncbi:hypothetical protein Scep_007823 [Stephania cephalantha]|uniref:Uncharacterized protein n=1 Tax=Stephania cephalantha TaxID=152367 RepID=A0AAP0PQE4_9MAGN